MEYNELKVDLDNIVASMDMNSSVLDIVAAIVETLRIHGVPVFDDDNSVTREAADQLTLVFGDMVGRILLSLCADASLINR